jgi:hypothetical protein
VITAVCQECRDLEADPGDVLCYRCKAAPFEVNLAEEASPNGPPPASDREPRNLAELLGHVEALFRKYVRFPNRFGSVALALWVAVTHAQDAFDVAPYINITSPEKRSGKSRILEVAEHLVRKPQRVDNASPAYIYRTMAGSTLLLDEADKVFTGKDEYSAALTGAINGGWRRGSGAGRVDKNGSQQVPVKFDAFGPKMLAGIGRKVPDTIQDRAIPIYMERKAAGEQVARLRWRKLPAETKSLLERLSRWATASAARLAEAEPVLPEELHDRAQDIWEPLLAVADAAGGEWPQRAREAAVALHGAFFEDDSLGVRLLRDIRATFASQDRISSADLVSALNEIEESPWGGWPMDARKLAWNLKPFKAPGGDKIKPGTVRLEEGTAKGYYAEQFEDAWKRYLDAPIGEASQASRPANAQPAALQPVTAVTGVTDTPIGEGAVAAVADAPGAVALEDDPEDYIRRRFAEEGERNLFVLGRELRTLAYPSAENGGAWTAVTVEESLRRGGLLS